jgi:HEPN domain-containing protein
MQDKRPKQYQLLMHKAIIDVAVVEHLLELKANDIDRDVLLFHLEQAAEKFLKAILSYNNIHFEKTHDIVELLELCSTNNIPLPKYADEFENLYPYAVQGRYDFLVDDDLNPKKYCDKLSEFKAFIEQHLGIAK